jgi:hypothetical protein
MNQIYMWLLAYVIPGFLAGVVIKFLPKSKDRVGASTIALATIALIVSTSISQYFIYTSGLVFPWHPKALSIASYILSVFIATHLIGKMTIWYSLFAFIQELAISSITFLLLPYLPLYLIILLIVPLFVWGHDLQTSRWVIRTILFTTFGAIAIFLFSLTLDFYLLAALHTLVGAILISRFVVYPSD